MLGIGRCYPWFRAPRGLLTMTTINLITNVGIETLRVSLISVGNRITNQIPWERIEIAHTALWHQTWQHHTTVSRFQI
jgi:hypothetical protein